MLLQVNGGGNDGVIEGGASARLNFFQPFFQLIDAGSEILVELVLVVEIDDADFVTGIRRAHQVERGRIHLGPLFAHGARVVVDDAQGDGNIFAVKRGDSLRVPVFENGEATFIEIGDDVLLVVDDGGVQDDFIHLLAEYKHAAIGGIRVLGGACGRRAGGYMGVGRSAALP